MASKCLTNPHSQLESVWRVNRTLLDGGLCHAHPLSACLCSACFRGKCGSRAAKATAPRGAAGQPPGRGHDGIGGSGPRGNPGVRHGQPGCSTSEKTTCCPCNDLPLRWPKPALTIFFATVRAQSVGDCGPLGFPRRRPSRRRPSKMGATYSHRPSADAETCGER